MQFSWMCEFQMRYLNTPLWYLIATGNQTIFYFYRVLLSQTVILLQRVFRQSGTILKWSFRRPCFPAVSDCVQWSYTVSHINVLLVLTHEMKSLWLNERIRSFSQEQNVVLNKFSQGKRTGWKRNEDISVYRTNSHKPPLAKRKKIHCCQMRPVGKSFFSPDKGKVQKTQYISFSRKCLYWNSQTFVSHISSNLITSLAEN